MLKEIMRTTLSQGKHKNIFFNVWCWLYSQTNEHNVYYGTMKEITEACQIDYQKLNRAFELQKQWNTIDFEKTIIMRKIDSEFIPQHNNHTAKKYFNYFKINVSNIRSLYQPIIIVFNEVPYGKLLQQKLEYPHSEEEIFSPNKEDVHQATLDETEGFNGEGATKKKPAKKSGKEKKPAHVKKNPDISKALQNACLDVYIDFYELRTGVKPKLDTVTEGGKQIAALLRMIKYFRSNNKENTDAAIIGSFDLIFQNWDKFSEFHQAQFKLTEIESNLPNLIAVIKNAGKTLNKSKSAKAAAFSNKFATIIDSGLLDNKIENLGKPNYTNG